MAQFTVTIDNTKVAGDIDGFPVYIDLSDMPASFWSTVANGGGDIRCYEDDGTTELAREVVSCDTATETGELHVKFAGTVSSSLDTEIIIDVDGARSDYAVGATFGRNAVWSGYGFVSHDGGGTDSSGNVSTTGNGGVTAGGATGKIGAATNFNGSTQWFDLPNNLGLDNTGFTLQGWFNTDTTNDAERMYGFYDGSDDILLTGPTADKLQFRAGHLSGGTEFDIRNTEVSETVSAGIWYLTHATYNGTTGIIYQDGVSVGSESASISDPFDDTAVIDIGRRSDDAQYFTGELDELRILANALSADWITTEYNNQNSPSTFYTTAESGGGATFTPIVMSF